MKILVAVDGSENANRAVTHVCHLTRCSGEPLEVHLLNVQPPITFGQVKKHVSQEALNTYYHDEGVQALRAARALLQEAAVTHTDHIAIGPAAETIVEYAREHGCEQIVLGCRGLGSLSSLLLGSVASKVIHLAEVPVTLVK